MEIFKTEPHYYLRKFCANDFDNNQRPNKKEEEVHLNVYEDIHEARARIGHFITQVYNEKRPHSALEYLTPVEFQEKTRLNFAKFWSK